MTLSQLKKDLKPGLKLQVINHIRKEVIGSTSQVVKVQSNAFFHVYDNDKEKRPFHIEYPKASLVVYDIDTLTIYLDEKTLLISFKIIN